MLYFTARGNAPQLLFSRAMLCTDYMKNIVTKRQVNTATQYRLTMLCSQMFHDLPHIFNIQSVTIKIAWRQSTGLPIRISDR